MHNDQAAPATSLGTLAAAVLIAIAGTAMFNLSPLFLAAAALEHGIGDRQLGLLMSSEVAGIALASFIVLLRIEHSGPARLAAVGGSVILAGNLLALAAPDFSTLLLIRFLVGLAGDGLAYASAIAILGRYRDPIRAYGIYAFCSMCFTGTALVLLPQLAGGTSWQGLLGLFTLLGLLALGASRFLSHDDRPVWESAKPISRSPVGWVALAGIFAFTLNLGAIWGYAERMGAAAGLDIRQVGFYLGLSIAFQALGSLAAALWSKNRNHRLLLTAILAAQLTGILLIGNAADALSYAAGVALWGMSWNFGIANMLGWLAMQPSGRRLLPLAPGTEALGAAAGPAAVGLITLLPLGGVVMLLAGLGAIAATVLFAVLLPRLQSA